VFEGGGGSDFMAVSDGDSWPWSSYKSRKPPWGVLLS
jgi:hypothetical protein